MPKGGACAVWVIAVVLLFGPVVGSKAQQPQPQSSQPIATEWYVPGNTLICVDLLGLEQAKYTMNKAQLDSLGCLVTARDVGIERNNDRFGYVPSGPERVSIMFPDKVVGAWVRGHALKKSVEFQKWRDEENKLSCARYRKANPTPKDGDVMIRICTEWGY